MTIYQRDVQFLNAPRGKIIKFSLPRGKSLTMEFLTACFTLNGVCVAPCVFVHCVLAGKTVQHFIPLTQLDSNNWGVAQVVKLYADAGTSVGIQVSSVNGGTFYGHVTLAGQLLP